MSRGYHNLTAYYNVYYNGNDAFKTGAEKVNKAYQDNYSVILPVFQYSNEEACRTAFAEMNRAIEKGSKCIQKHSITAKPKENKKNKFDPDQKEFVKWIDDSYLLIGKANFYKRDFYPAIETFNYLIKEYSNQPVKYEAYMWLARCYIEMKKLDKARDYLGAIVPDIDKIPKNLLGPYYMTWADAFLREQKFIEALPYLEKGVQNTSNKTLKARYFFIMAQVYHQVEENRKAYIAYGKVIDLNPAYQMTFNAKINRASIFNAEANDSKQLIRELNKMLKDEKNIDYRDQIYYALGNIALSEERIPDAVGFFKLSTQVSTSNDNQKGMSFLALAELYYTEPNYKNAQIYYDSTVTFLDHAYPDFAAIKRLNENLNELVFNLEIIHTQDSLQKMARMSEAERNVIIDKVIEGILVEEEQKRQLEAQDKQDLAFLEQTNSQAANEGGKWYFYNTQMMATGAAEFKKKWGNRKLEDDWRRKNKELVIGDQMVEVDTASASKANSFSNKTRDYYLVDLPMTDSARLASSKKIEEAYFNIATIYKDKFYDYPLSISAYNKLLADYPQTGFRLQSYYNMYKLYMLTKDKEQAEIYKNKIINEYPNSDYALILINPDYFKEQEKVDRQINFLYQATYKYFLVDNCVEVSNNYHFADSAYPASPLIPKFALLNTLCVGHSGDTILFKGALADFMKKFPKTEEADYAQEVMNALDRKPHQVVLAEVKPEIVDQFAQGNKVDSIDYSMYNLKPNTEYLYIVVVANDKADANRVKFNVSNFNIDYYSYLDFTVESEFISTEFSVIAVRKFKNQNMAANYYESMFVANEVFEDLNKDSYRAYIISTENYAKFLGDKVILRYQRFFEANFPSLIQK